ncbi:fructose-bisphosphatase class II [Shigella flexneri]
MSPPACSTCWQDNPYHVMYTIGGAPEGVISACAVKALGGDMQAELIDFCQAKGDYTENLGRLQSSASVARQWVLT